MVADPTVALFYSSHATVAFSDQALRHLLIGSRARNWDRGVTSLLLYRPGRFVHYIEGPASEVDSQMDRIRDDRRHTRLHTISGGPRPDRLFPKWTMAFTEVTPTSPPAIAALFDAIEDDNGVRADKAEAVLSGLAVLFADRRR